MSAGRTGLRSGGRRQDLPRSGRRPRGISLVEVLVVVVLFSVGLVGLMAMKARAVQFSVSAEDSGRAGLLAAELAAQMWAANTVDLPEQAVKDWNARVADATGSGLPNGQGSVTLDGNVARITIQWREPSAAAGQEKRYATQVLIATP